MPIVTVLIIIAVFGFVMWLVNTLIPMQPPFKTIFNAVGCLILLLWLLTVLFPGIGSATVPSFGHR